MYPVVASIVLYKNQEDLLLKTINSFLKTPLNVKLYLVDNSPTDKLRNIITDARVEYSFNGKNLGFGKAHNQVLRETLNNSSYHIVLNPDVIISEGTIEKLYEYMEQNKDVGLILPKVLDFNSNIQYLCKRLPSPYDLFVRRFGLPFFEKLSSKRLIFYEMRDKNYELTFEAPSLSGCFMFLRSESLKQIGLFDERFFMYLEDVDLSRRIHLQFKTLYYPGVKIYHGHSRGSYRVNKLMLIHVISAFRYFNKWGWFERDRKKINSKA